MSQTVQPGLRDVATDQKVNKLLGAGVRVRDCTTSQRERVPPRVLVKLAGVSCLYYPRAVIRAGQSPGVGISLPALWDWHVFGPPGAGEVCAGEVSRSFRGPSPQIVPQTFPRPAARASARLGRCSPRAHRQGIGCVPFTSTLTVPALGVHGTDFGIVVAVATAPVFRLKMITSSRPFGNGFGRPLGNVSRIST
jgi:hypothetical protein